VNKLACGPSAVLAVVAVLSVLYGDLPLCQRAVVLAVVAVLHMDLPLCVRAVVLAVVVVLHEDLLSGYTSCSSSAASLRVFIIISVCLDGGH
jgi:hypothetical protein